MTVGVSILEALGFDPFFASQITPEEARTLLPGRAIADRGRRLLVRFEDAERLVTLPGRLRGSGEAPVVGDFVLAHPGDEPPVARVLVRRTQLSRAAAGRATAEQVLVANVDLAFLVQGLDAGVNPRRIERTLAAVHASGVAPVVLLTKIDLDDDPGEALELARAAALGVPVHAVSGTTGEGLEAIRSHLAPGRTGVFVGPSGAGKSTLVNALLGAELQPTAEVRLWDGRGRHTTSGRRLIALQGGGAVIDGPGVRELKLWDPDGIEGAFKDVAAIAAGCRFGDCAHEDEPGCAVLAAMDEGRLDPDRLFSMKKLEGEARAAQARRGGAEARAEKQRWRAVAKARKRLSKDRERE
jgi:ribosome biogenesis GTPase / thiamine phosphate phosphatase